MLQNFCDAFSCFIKVKHLRIILMFGCIIPNDFRIIRRSSTKTPNMCYMFYIASYYRIFALSWSSWFSYSIFCVRLVGKIICRFRICTFSRLLQKTNQCNSFLKIEIINQVTSICSCTCPMNSLPNIDIESTNFYTCSFDAGIT